MHKKRAAIADFDSEFVRMEKTQDSDAKLVLLYGRKANALRRCHSARKQQYSQKADEFSWTHGSISRSICPAVLAACDPGTP
jgi:hypothetical protein